MVPKTNTDFWIEKVKRNQKRDEKVWRDLESEQWSVVIVWECELEKKRFEETVNRVENEIREIGEKYRMWREERKLLREQRLAERKDQKRRYDQINNARTS